MRIQTYPLLLLLVCVASCKGQVKTNVPKESADTATIIANEQPKLIKPQGIGPGASVRCGLLDKSGNLWFGTTGAGVYRYDGTSFVNFTVKDGLSNDFIWSISEDTSGNLWFGTSDGASRYDGTTFTRVPIAVINGSNLHPDASSHNELSFDPYGNPSEENAVWDIMQDKAGELWFGTTTGVYRYDGKSFSPFIYNSGYHSGAISSSGISLNKIEYIVEDKAGDIWFGGRGNKGVFRFDGNSLTNLKPNGNGWLWPMLEDRAGNIWFASFDGAYRYDGESFVDFAGKDGFSTTIITCIYEDKSGNIWYGSDDEHGGVCRYDGKTFTHFTTKDGLLNNSVCTVVQDRNGDIWVGTRTVGLCRFDGKTFVSFSA